MGLVCKIGGHKWKHCKCERCGERRGTDHNWQGSKIEKCLQTCSVCGEKQNTHDWNGCVCTKCKEQRDEGHNWNGCICSGCGKKLHEESEKHKYVSADNLKEKCEICGTVRYNWDAVRNLTDPRLLMEIALSSDDAARAAVQNIRDRNAITKVATSSKNKDAATLAVMMLTSSSSYDLLEKIAIEGQFESVAEMAYETIIGKLYVGNESALMMRSKRIMKASKHAVVRERAKGLLEALV